jgi:hypothetical protein
MMAEMAMAEQGWRTLDLGPDVPAASLRDAVARYRPRLVWVSVTSLAPRPAFLADYPAFFDAARAAGVAVALGGQGVTVELQRRVVASAFGTRLAHLRAFAEGLR